MSWGKLQMLSLPSGRGWTWAIVAALCLATEARVALAAAPTAEVAKRCIHYSYVAYPYKRPGAVRMSSDRQTYLKDCLAKNGDVPAPTPPPKL